MSIEILNDNTIEELIVLKSALNNLLVMAGEVKSPLIQPTQEISKSAVTFSEAKDYVLNVEKPALIHLVALLCSDVPGDYEFAKKQIKEFSRMFKL